MLQGKKKEKILCTEIKFNEVADYYVNFLIARNTHNVYSMDILESKDIISINGYRIPITDRKQKKGQIGSLVITAQSTTILPNLEISLKVSLAKGLPVGKTLYFSQMVLINS